MEWLFPNLSAALFSDPKHGQTGLLDNTEGKSTISEPTEISVNESIGFNVEDQNDLRYD